MFPFQYNSILHLYCTIKVFVYLQHIEHFPYNFGHIRPNIQEKYLSQSPNIHYIIHFPKYEEKISPKL